MATKMSHTERIRCMAHGSGCSSVVRARTSASRADHLFLADEMLAVTPATPEIETALVSPGEEFMRLWTKDRGTLV
jgi:hypothetical protein